VAAEWALLVGCVTSRGVRAAWNVGATLVVGTADSVTEAAASGAQLTKDRCERIVDGGTAAAAWSCRAAIELRRCCGDRNVYWHVATPSILSMRLGGGKQRRGGLGWFTVRRGRQRQDLLRSSRGTSVAMAEAIAGGGSTAIRVHGDAADYSYMQTMGCAVAVATSEGLGGGTAVVVALCGSTVCVLSLDEGIKAWSRSAAGRGLKSAGCSVVSATRRVHNTVRAASHALVSVPHSAHEKIGSAARVVRAKVGSALTTRSVRQNLGSTFKNKAVPGGGDRNEIEKSYETESKAPSEVSYYCNNEAEPPLLPNGSYEDLDRFTHFVTHDDSLGSDAGMGAGIGGINMRVNSRGEEFPVRVGVERHGHFEPAVQAQAWATTPSPLPRSWLHQSVPPQEPLSPLPPRLPADRPLLPPAPDPAPALAPATAPAPVPVSSSSTSMPFKSQNVVVSLQQAQLDNDEDSIAARARSIGACREGVGGQERESAEEEDTEQEDPAETQSTPSSAGSGGSEQPARLPEAFNSRWMGGDAYPVVNSRGNSSDSQRREAHEGVAMAASSSSRESQKPQLAKARHAARRRNVAPGASLIASAAAVAAARIFDESAAGAAGAAGAAMSVIKGKNGIALMQNPVPEFPDEDEEEDEEVDTEMEEKRLLVSSLASSPATWRKRENLTQTAAAVTASEEDDFDYFFVKGNQSSKRRKATPPESPASSMSVPSASASGSSVRGPNVASKAMLTNDSSKFFNRFSRDVADRLLADRDDDDSSEDGEVDGADVNDADRRRGYSDRSGSRSTSRSMVSAFGESPTLQLTHAAAVVDASSRPQTPSRLVSGCDANSFHSPATDLEESREQQRQAVEEEGEYGSNMEAVDQFLMLLDDLHEDDLTSPGPVTTLLTARPPPTPPSPPPVVAAAPVAAAAAPPPIKTSGYVPPADSPATTNAPVPAAPTAPTAFAQGRWDSKAEVRLPLRRQPLRKPWVGQSQASSMSTSSSSTFDRSSASVDSGQAASPISPVAANTAWSASTPSEGGWSASTPSEGGGHVSAARAAFEREKLATRYK